MVLQIVASSMLQNQQWRWILLGLGPMTLTGFAVCAHTFARVNFFAQDHTLLFPAARVVEKGCQCWAPFAGRWARVVDCELAARVVQTGRGRWALALGAVSWLRAWWKQGAGRSLRARGAVSWRAGAGCAHRAASGCWRSLRAWIGRWCRALALAGFSLSIFHRLRQALCTTWSGLDTCATSAVQKELVRWTSSAKPHIKRTRNTSYTRTLCLSRSLTHSLNHALLLLSPHCLVRSPLSRRILLSSFLISLYFSLLPLITHLTRHSSHSLLLSSIFPSSFLLSLCFSLLVLSSLTCGVIRSFYLFSISYAIDTAISLSGSSKLIGLSRRPMLDAFCRS